jgi:hypothetical protein
MTKILDRLPIPTRDDVAFVGQELVRLKETEIIVWVSLSTRAALEWNPATPRFPGIVDTGHTHNFSIQEQHLIRWAGLRPETLYLLGNIRTGGHRLPLRAADLWLHRNQPYQRDQFRDTPPQRLILPKGIAVCPDSLRYPRLPLIGLRALLSNHLHLTVDGERNAVTLRTADWKTRLLRLLA